MTLCNSSRLGQLRRPGQTSTAPTLLRVGNNLCKNGNYGARLGLEEINEGVGLLDFVHHVDHEFCACVGGPGLGPSCLNKVRPGFPQSLVARVVEGVDVVAVHTKRRRTGYRAGEAGTVEDEVNPSSSGIVVVGEPVAEMFPHPGESQLQVVVP